MALENNELKRQLETAHHEVQILTEARQLAPPPTPAQCFDSPPEFTSQSALTMIGSPPVAPGSELPPSPSHPQNAMASQANTPAVLLPQSPTCPIDPQQQPPPTFQQLAVTPECQAMMYYWFSSNKFLSTTLTACSL